MIKLWLWTRHVFAAFCGWVWVFCFFFGVYDLAGEHWWHFALALFVPAYGALQGASAVIGFW